MPSTVKPSDSYALLKIIHVWDFPLKIIYQYDIVVESQPLGVGRQFRELLLPVPLHFEGIAAEETLWVRRRPEAKDFQVCCARVNW